MKANPKQDIEGGVGSIYKRHAHSKIIFVSFCMIKKKRNE
jgi:hypothetical protein